MFKKTVLLAARNNYLLPGQEHFLISVKNNKLVLNRYYTLMVSYLEQESVRTKQTQVPVSVYGSYYSSYNKVTSWGFKVCDIILLVSFYQTPGVSWTV